ncbi:hypothetical protein MEBOL_004918 [Melittangium boletus DSM 14713]|uniref:Uncharacterized protein n=2 Tax=Melittangium boletus TaxID=83453 RepID=A0A250II78_9BACT|nr:hypothetical protein MEBOL_004918 [Melittangium boletus DSM 14713]
MVLAGCGSDSAEPPDTGGPPVTDSAPRPPSVGGEPSDAGTPSSDGGSPSYDGGSPSYDGGSSADAGSPDAGHPHEVRGTRVLHYRTDLADFTQPIDPLSPELEAFALESGGLRPLTVVTSPDGTFRIPDAPAGRYYLRLDTLHVLTDSRTVNLDNYELGRQDAVKSNPGPITVSLSNIKHEPFNVTPIWQAVSSNVGLMAYVNASSPIPAYTSELNKHPVSYTQISPTESVLLDASRGDRLYFNSFIDRDSGYFRYAAIERSTTPDPVTMAPSTETELRGVFTGTPQKTLNFEWWRSRFEAYQTQVHPQSTATNSQTVSISPTAWGSDAWYGYSGDLMYSYGNAGITDARVNISYGNPFPFSWGEVLTVAHNFRLDVRLPGTSTGTLSDGLSDRRRVETAIQGPIAPRISPAQNVTVDGLNAQQERTLGSLTPRIAWKAPLVGMPSAYRVRISRLSVQDRGNGTSATAVSHVAYLSTRETAVDVLPGILEPGQKYVFTVTSYLTPGIDLSTHPYGHMALSDAADAATMSSILTTPAALAGEHAPLRLEPEPSLTHELEFKAPRHLPRAP